MDQRGALFLFVALGGTLFASGATAQERDWSRQIAALEDVSEEALTDVTGPSVVSGSDCVIDANEVDALDGRLVLPSNEVEDSLRVHGPWGFPTEKSGQNQLVHREYVLVHDAATKQPAYAQYRLVRADIASGPRIKCFRSDERLDADDRAELADYREPIFDRGHLVPRADMNRARSVMLNTFLLSNMMPQHSDYNQRTWAMLEGLVRTWAKAKLDVLVVSGPIYDHNGDGLPDEATNLPRVAPQDRLAVPSHFFKIVLHERPNGYIEAIAIKLPHEEHAPDAADSDARTRMRLQRIEDAIVSIDQIERAKGMDFFAGLNDSKETAIERSIASGLW